MATETENGFDETFRNLVTRFDDNQPGGGETAYRKSVIFCAKNGLTFVDAVARAFGQEDGGGEVAELRDEVERLKQGGDELADALGQAKQTIAALQNGQTQERGEGHAGFKAWFRHAWSFAQFRLLALTVIIAAAMVLDAALGPAISGLPDARDVVVWQRIWGGFVLAAVLYLFGAWSVAQYRRQGLPQMFMKWVVYCSVVAVGCIALPRCPGLLVVLLVAMVLTLSRLNEWLGEQVRMRVWESDRVRVVRGWF